MSSMHTYFSLFQFLEYSCTVCLLKELKLPRVQKGENHQLAMNGNLIQSVPFEFSLNVFTEFSEFNDKNIIFKKDYLFQHTACCVRDKDATCSTVSARHG